MSDTSWFGFQSDSPSARLAYDMCILEEEKKHAEKKAGNSAKGMVYNVLLHKFQTYEEFYGKEDE